MIPHSSDSELGQIFAQTIAQIDAHIDKQRSAVEEREAREALAIPQFVELLRDFSRELALYDPDAIYRTAIDTQPGITPVQVSLKRGEDILATFLLRLTWQSDDDLALELIGISVPSYEFQPQDLVLPQPLLWQVHRLGITAVLRTDRPSWGAICRKLAAIAATLACRSKYGAEAVAAARKALVASSGQ